MNRYTTYVASFCVSLTLGFLYSWSVFQQPLEEALQESASKLTLVFTIFISVSSLASIFGGAFQDRFGPRAAVIVCGVLYGGGILLSGFADSSAMMYVTYGICSGIGSGFGYCSVIANTTSIFPEKKGMMVGVLLAAYSSGSLIFAPLSQRLIELAGVMDTLKIFGVIAGIMILGASLFIRRAPQNVDEVWQELDDAKDKNWRQMLESPMFYGLFSMVIITTTAGMMITSKASPMTQDIIGASPMQAAWIVGSISVANSLGRIFWGSLSDKMGRAKTLTVVYTLNAFMLLILCFPDINTPGLFVGTILICGFCYGGGMGIFPAITTDLFGSLHSGTNFGFVLSATAVGGFAGPILASELAVRTGNYDSAFIFAAALCMIGIWVSFRIFRKERNDR